MTRLLCIAILLAAMPLAALAAPRTLEAEHTYVLGEGDTRADARRICLLEAKRKLVEQVGTWVESRTEVNSLALTQDQIRTFASAFVRVEVTSERFFMSGEAFAVSVSVRGEVDPDAVAPRLMEYASQPDRRTQLLRLSERSRTLEGTALGGGDAAIRGRALRSLEELEAEKARLVEETARLGQAAEAVVEPGMTGDEVRGLLGEPRVTKLNETTTSQYACWNYGRVWVVFRDGLVACKRTRLSYRQDYGGDCHCAGLPSEVFTR